MIFISARALGADTSNRTQQPLSRPQPGKQVLQITEEVEGQIAHAFEEGRCDEVNQLVSPEQAPQMRPLLQAVVGYCYPDKEISESLFGLAEKADPTNEMILVLHARHQWGIDPDSTTELWQKVLQFSRNKIIRSMADDYLQGTVERGKQAELVLQRDWNYFVSAQAGGSHETNPGALAQSDPGSKNASSSAKNLIFGGGIQRSTEFGSMALNYGLLNNRYQTTHTSDYMVHAVEVPVTIRADLNTDLTVRPFASTSTLGNVGFQNIVGLGVLAWAYKSKFNQSVEGQVFRNFYVPPDLQAQQGLHFRIDYSWEFYPENLFLKFIFSFEHVAADIDADPTTNTNITYSHNDIGLSFFTEYHLGPVVLGLSPRFLTRQDDNDSRYPPNDSSVALLTKRRQDYQIILQPSLTIPISQGIQIFSWYEYNRIYSNLNANDYADRNVMNQTVGIALRTFLGNF